MNNVGNLFGKMTLPITDILEYNAIFTKLYLCQQLNELHIQELKTNNQGRFYKLAVLEEPFPNILMKTTAKSFPQENKRKRKTLNKVENITTKKSKIKLKVVVLAGPNAYRDLKSYLEYDPSKINVMVTAQIGPANTGNNKQIKWKGEPLGNNCKRFEYFPQNSDGLLGEFSADFSDIEFHEGTKKHLQDIGGKARLSFTANIPWIDVSSNMWQYSQYQAVSKQFIVMTNENQWRTSLSSLISGELQQQNMQSCYLQNLLNQYYFTFAKNEKNETECRALLCSELDYLVNKGRCFLSAKESSIPSSFCHLLGHIRFGPLTNLWHDGYIVLISKYQAFHFLKDKPAGTTLLRLSEWKTQESHCNLVAAFVEDTAVCASNANIVEQYDETLNEAQLKVCGVKFEFFHESVEDDQKSQKEQKEEAESTNGMAPPRKEKFLTGLLAFLQQHQSITCFLQLKVTGEWSLLPKSEFLKKYLQTSDQHDSSQLYYNPLYEKH